MFANFFPHDRFPAPPPGGIWGEVKSGSAMELCKRSLISSLRKKNIDMFGLDLLNSTNYFKNIMFQYIVAEVQSTV